MGLGHWMKEHMNVTYKGVNITDEIGLCICEECTKKIRAHVDKELKPCTSTSITKPDKTESEVKTISPFDKMMLKSLNETIKHTIKDLQSIATCCNSYINTERNL